MRSNLKIDHFWPNISQSILRAAESSDIQNNQADLNVMGTKIYVQETLYIERTCMKRTAFLMHKFFWDAVYQYHLYCYNIAKCCCMFQLIVNGDTKFACKIIVTFSTLLHGRILQILCLLTHIISFSTLHTVQLTVQANSPGKLSRQTVQAN